MTTKDGFRIGAQMLDRYLEDDLRLRRQRLLMGATTVDYEDGKQAGLEKAMELLRETEAGMTVSDPAQPHEEPRYFEDWDL